MLLHASCKKLKTYQYVLECSRAREPTLQLRFSVTFTKVSKRVYFEFMGGYKKSFVGSYMSSCDLGVSLWLHFLK